MKGLNSFIEEQTIDFSELTSCGLFGIFGPTGSGKTTILDGITLALYGEVARQSTNFINTNCKSAHVLFEFQISGNEVRRYVVEREFRQDPKKGGYKTGKCRLSDITEEPGEIIAEKVREVTNAVVDIIGLKLDDFQRTVVLPQGKFSDFLKLDGKERSNMLERLFRLQSYGDELTNRLRERRRKEQFAKEKLDGQILAHDGVSGEIISDKEKEKEDLKARYVREQEKLDQILKEFEEKQKIWKLQVELESLREKREELRQKRVEMDKVKQGIENMERAKRVVPYIHAYTQTSKELQLVESDLTSSREQLQSLQEKRNEVLEQWNLFNKKKLDEVPLYLEQEKQLQEGIVLQEDICHNQQTIEETKSKLKTALQESETLEKALEKEKEELASASKTIAKLEKKEREHQVDSVYRQNVATGCSLLEKISMNKEQLDKEEERFHKLEDELKAQSKKAKEMQEILYEKEEVKNVHALQNNLIEAQSNWKRYKELTLELEKIMEKKESLEKIVQKQNELVIVQEEIVSNQKEKLRQIEIRNLAHTLQKELKLGEPCPVCGSEHFELSNVNREVREDEMETAQQDSKQAEQKLQEMNQKLAQSKAQLDSILQLEISNKDAMERLGSNFRKYTEEEVQEKQNMIYPYTELVTKIKESQKNYETLKNTLDEWTKQKEQLTKELMQLNQVCQIEDFFTHQEKIKESDTMLKKIQDSLTESRRAQSNLSKAMDEKKERQMQVVKERATFEETVRQLETLLEKQNEKWDSLLASYENQITVVDGKADLSKTVENIVEKRKAIENKFAEAEEQKQKVEEQYVKVNELNIKLSSNFELLTKQIEKDKINLSQALASENFASQEECLESMVEESIYRKNKIVLEQYENEVTKNLGLLEDARKKIGTNSIDKNEWIRINIQKDNYQAEVEQLKEQIVRISQELEVLHKRWDSLKELVEKQKKLEHQLSLLDELERLFRGKRFVEFVAQSRLEYISKGASKRLKEISNGTYGLEVSETGKFVICDYKNGGVKRDASTLSGGETFLVSLSLALSLSEQVQLKGTAPLELFFLDEGFGTLDDELLDVVMDSLEKVQNDKLKVGIISHVESVKNRVPMKLIVTPAQSGLGGTKVKIERN